MTLVSSVQQRKLSHWPWFYHLHASSKVSFSPSQLAEHDGGEWIELHGEADVFGGRQGQGRGGEGGCCGRGGHGGEEGCGEEGGRSGGGGGVLDRRLAAPGRLILLKEGIPGLE